MDNTSGKANFTVRAAFNLYEKISKQTAHCGMEENHMACPMSAQREASLLSAEPEFAFLLEKRKQAEGYGELSSNRSPLR